MDSSAACRRADTGHVTERGNPEQFDKVGATVSARCLFSGSPFNVRQHRSAVVASMVAGDASSAAKIVFTGTFARL